MDIPDLITLPLEIVAIVSWWRLLARQLKNARVQSTFVPRPVRAACLLLGLAAVSWTVCSFVVSSWAFGIPGTVDAIMNATFCFSFLALLAASLLHGGIASYWVLVAFAIPAFLLISGVIMLFQSTLLFSGGWLSVLAALGWLSCAAAVVLLLLPRSFRFFRAAYLAAMASTKVSGNGVG